MTKEQEVNYMKIAAYYEQYLTRCNEQHIEPIEFKYWLSMNGYHIEKEKEELTKQHKEKEGGILSTFFFVFIYY